MKELKNLIKIIAIAVVLSLPYSAHAQILDMSVDLSPLQLTDDFLRSLYYCKQYHGEKTSSYEKINVKTVYDVLGMKDGKCQLKVEGFTNTSVHITQECNLTPEQAKEYADSLSNYQVNKFSPRFDEKRINSNEYYQKAMDIMGNPEICTILRDKIDHTSAIRANLPECLPVKKTEKVLDSKVMREIVGKEEINERPMCHYRFTLWQPKPDVSHISPEVLEKAPELRDVEFNYDCFWDEITKQKYFDVLDAFVIPEEEGYDFYAVDRPNSWEEIDFILHNCQYIPSNK